MSACTCFPVEEKYWTTHYGAVDPATTIEPNPECPEHFPDGEKPVSAWDLLGIAPDWTAGKSTDEWMDEQRGRP